MPKIIKRKNASNPFAIALATNNAFTPGFLVTLATVLAASDLTSAQIYILYDQNENIDKLWEQALAVCRQFDFPEDRLQRLPVDLSSFEGFNTINENHLTYARIYGAVKIPEERLIYLDSDLLVRGDISTLVEHFSNEHPIAAVPDRYTTYHHEEGYQIEHELPPKDKLYFNAGVMIFNTNYCRQIDLWAQVSALHARMTKIPFADQTYLNILFQDNWQKLAPAWNHIYARRDPPLISVKNDKTKIYHFITRKKPWNFPTIDIPHFTWNCIYRSLKIEQDEPISKAYQRLISNESLGLRTGWTRLKSSFYRLRKPRSRKAKEFIILQNFKENQNDIHEWLEKRPFKGVPEHWRL